MELKGPVVTYCMLLEPFLLCFKGYSQRTFCIGTTVMATLRRAQAANTPWTCHKVLYSQTTNSSQTRKTEPKVPDHN